ncbi:AlkA N-terminal domain-containing protein [Methylocystis sp. IM3]|uniref:DNA-3-methyladenine glycosylase 2 family protein n=1 Tax=unclassified Methylocystis TaxID=2625913 RepID=UPI0030FB2DE8
MDLGQDAYYSAVRTRDARFDGRFFGAVKTTGIYCRPICPATTPKRQNLVFYPTAAAAEEAGFRPCLRCRPETAPDVSAWRGASDTVNRALTLIEHGALDDGCDVTSLAKRFGVGERQLRRLFRQHLGASPTAVAQTRRVHLAKQLLHETRLPMSEIALASGFGTIRRFNMAFEKLFGRRPSALRRASAEEISAGLGGEVTVRLRYRPPYDWQAMLGFLAARAVPGVELVDGGAYNRVIDIDGKIGAVQITPARDEDALIARVRFHDLSRLPVIIATLRRVFDLSADPQAINEHLLRDAALAPLIAARPGLRAPGGWDGFELAVRAILGQQVTVRAAIDLATKLVADYGESAQTSATGDTRLTHAFPRPERLANAEVQLGMPNARARAISAIAAAVTADQKLLDIGRSLEDGITRLRALPGIGEWTAQYIALRGMREPDAFPAADVGLMRALANEAGIRPNAVELLARAEAWRPWRAYAAQHLWAASPTASEKAARSCS